MAQRHGIQDNPELDGAKAILGGESHGALVLGLGINVWVTHVLLTLVSRSASPAQHVVGACALLCLLLGVAARMTIHGEQRERTARWLLLCVYPGTIGLALSLGSEQVRETAYTALSMPLCAASLLAYGAAAVIACRQPSSLLASESHPLNGRESVAPVPRLRGFVIAMVLGGGFAITVVAPLWPAYGELASAWGDAAEAGAVLTALAATAIAVSVIVVHLGAALRRAERRVDTVPKRRNRVATLLFLTVLGFVTYFTVTP
jgi:hypothetical protein